MSANPKNIMPLPGQTLEQLVEQLVAAKKAENDAKSARVEIEERILALVPPREEGSSTRALGNGLKVTVTGSLTYKADDIEAVKSVVAKWPRELNPVKTEPKLDEAACKWLRANREDLWKQLAKVVTVKPAKSSVKVGA